MNRLNFRKIAPYLGIFAAFVLLSYAYTPELLSGKIVNQSDISSWQGMAQEIVSYNQSHPNDRALWTNSMFGGMPATQISVVYKGDFTQYIYDLFFTGERPASYLLISLVGGFLLLLSFGVNIWLAALGAFAITFCSYNMQIIQVGHNSKMVAIAFMPWVLAAIVYAYRRGAVMGALLFGIALSFQIKANHPQISYYLAMIIAGFAIWQLCAAVKQRLLPRFLKTSLMLLVAGLLGIAANLNHLLPTFEYAQHTMRGGTELSQSQVESGREAGVKSRSGLDLEYATTWSYGIEETPNLLIPNFNGGASAGALGRDSETYAFLKSSGYNAESIIQQMPLYWGPQPFTAGPMYMGAISIFLFLLAFFVLQGGIRWWAAGLSLLALLLGWGYHVMPVSEFFFNWVPLYNKFRTVSMILVILQIIVPLLAILALQRILFEAKPEERKKNLKGLAWAAGLSGGFCLIFALLPSLAGSFTSNADAGLPQQLLAPLAADRRALLSGDAWRSLIFILLAAAAVWASIKGKLKPLHAVALLALLIVADLWSIDKRYLNSSHFVSKSQFRNAFAERPVDKYILQDKDPDYRVLDLSVNTFNDSYVSYHHKTIGGYSPAKMQRYQDLIDHCITPEISSIAANLKSATDLESAAEAIGYQPVLNMLNTRYIVINEQYPPLLNKGALGNAWFVRESREARNADEEMALLKEIDPAKCAVLSKEFYKELPLGGTDTAATIALDYYSPNRLIYSYSSSVPQMALFSEVYYAPGWRAYLQPADSSTESALLMQNALQELPVLRANYILRALELPAGEYKILFEFAPELFRKGEFYSMAASSVLLILLLLVVIIRVVNRRES